MAEKTKKVSQAAAGIGAALLGNAYNAARAADDLNTLSRNTGIAVEELQKMQYASDLIDVSVDQMAGSLKKLTQQMGKDAKIFDELGVSIYDSSGNMRDATDVWYDSLAALSKIDNETERDALAMQLFGRSATELSGIIDDGGQALREMGQEAEDMGLVLSGDALKSANEFNDAIDRLKARTSAAFLSAGASLATSLAPALEKLVNSISKVLKAFAGLGGETQKTILIILGLVAAISPVAAMFSSITTIVAGVSAAIAFFSTTVGAAILLIGALVAAGVLLYKNWDKVVAYGKKLKDNTIKNFNDMKTGITNVMNAIKAAVTNAFNGVISTVRSAVSTAYNAAVGTFNAMRDGVAGAINGISGTVASVFWGVRDTISGAINAARDAVTGAVNTIKNAFNFSWSLPSIKLPHFRVSGGEAPWGFGGMGSLPKISVDWYKKAYENAVMFTQPTVLATASGLKGFGDGNGAEIVIGERKLREMMGGGGVTVNMTINGAGMNANEISDIVIDKLTATINRTRQRW